MLKKIIFQFLILFFGVFIFINAQAEKEISLDFRDIATRDLLKLLADFSGKNIIISDKITGKTTVKLEKMPWNEALDAILNLENLTKREENSLIYITPFENTENGVNKEATKSVVAKLKYAKAEDIANLFTKQHQMFSASGAMIADSRTNSLLIQDNPEKISEINNFIRAIDIPVKQALIEGRIVTIDDNFTKELGLKFSTSGGNSINGMTMDLPLTVNDPGHFGLAIAKLGDGVVLDMELSALENEGHAKIMSRPELLTRNNESAYIESGEEIPYQETSLSGGTSVTFKKAVLGLKVTPEIISNNKVILHLELNQDKPSTTNVNGVPAIITQQIQTEVTVSNNETIALGGIYEEDTESNIIRTPFLSSIPLVGNLFTSKNNTKTKRELMIFVTPKIVE